MPMTESGEPGNRTTMPRMLNHAAGARGCDCNHYNVNQDDSTYNALTQEKDSAFQTTNGGLYLRQILSLLVVFLTTSVVNAAPTKPSVRIKPVTRRGNRWPAAIVRLPVSGSATNRSAARIASKSSSLAFNTLDLRAAPIFGAPRMHSIRV
jgi:hypothetical protein